MSGPGEPYECAVCHGTFARTRSDEEAQAERRETWAEPFADDECGIVCADCWAQVMAWAQSLGDDTAAGPSIGVIRSGPS